MSSSRLLPCPSCARHVRAFEQSCPFCRAPLDGLAVAGPPPRAPAARLTRAALVAFGTGAIALAPACTSDSTLGSSGDSNIAPPYGLAPNPPDDAGGGALDGTFVVADVQVGSADAGSDVTVADAGSDAGGGGQSDAGNDAASASDAGSDAD